MTDYKLPDLPSDDDLGITDGDREEYEKNFPDDGPEMTDTEMAALLGDSPPQKKEPAKPTRRDKRKAAKEVRREEKRRAKEAKSRAKETDRAPEKETDRAPETAAPSVAAASRSRWRGPVTLAILTAIAVFSSSRTGLPRPVPANAPDTAFSSARAMATLVEVARAAHPPGSPEHERVRELLVDRLRALGLEPEVQTTTSMLQSPGVVRAATVRNIVARIPGTASTGAVLITAHYDSRGIAVGAADDGFGVVSIIEAVRALQASSPLRNDVIVLLTDAEELGLLGARAFVDQHPWLADVSLVLSVEMRGGGGPSIMFETNEQNGWVVRALAAFDSHPVANSISYEIYKRMSRDTDFTPFKEAGVQGLNFAAIDRANVYHQVYDRPENLSESTLQHHGIHALDALKYFGHADLSVVDAPNQVYLSLPLLGLVVYDQALAIPLSGVLVVLFGVTVLLGMRAGARPGRLAASLGVAVLAGALAFGSGFGLLTWLPRFHPEMGSLPGSAFHSEGWYMLALACAAFVIVTALTTVTQRWLSSIELALGAVLIPLIGAVAMSFATPLAAMNLQWPVMAALLSVLVLSLLGTRREGTVGWIAALVLAAPVLVMMVWLTELIWLAMSLRIAGILSVMMVVTLLLCVPALSALKHPNSWWAPLTGLVLGGLALAIGLLMSRPSPARPSPSTLVYAYEHGSGAAIWATSPSEADPESKARAWAVQRAGGPFAETRDLSAFGYRGGVVPVTSAPVVSAPPPRVILASDSIDENGRYVVLHVRSRIGAEMLRFEYDAQGSTRLVSLNGIAIDDPEGLRWAEHWGEPDGDVVLELTMPADESIGLHIIEHLLRPEELLGEDAFTRPDDLAADISWLSDRAMFRYSVAAFVDPRHAIMLPSAAPTDPVPEATEESTDSTRVDLPDTSVTATDTLGPVPDTIPR